MVSDSQVEVRSARGGDWRKAFARRLIVTDFLVLVWVVFGVQIAWFGFDSENVALGGNETELALSYSAVSILTLAAWMLLLQAFGTRGYRVVGTGSQEYRLIADASIRLFGLVAIVAFLFRIELARGYILIAFPLGLLVLLFSRWMWRQWLGVKRATGSYSSLVILVGSASSVHQIARELNRRPQAGYRVVGACLPSSLVANADTSREVPILGSLDDVFTVLESTGADTVVITSADELTPERVRELSWKLEPGRQHLVMAPSLTDIGGPRIHTRPVVGLPLIHVETPRYEGTKKFSKRALDFFGSGFILLVLSPLLVVIAIVVKASSTGPVFYRQQRIGLNGTPFDMLKFRSMVVDADARLKELLAAQGTQDTPLFKIKNDPRLTPAGGVLRKYSLDELPQLINVLRGDMSLVGPRPQREGEVALYDMAAKRRLFVQPGMTGLWQVSGRSTLSWEDAIRLDLYYVENWSFTGDILILLRTIGAVLAPGEDAI